MHCVELIIEKLDNPYNRTFVVLDLFLFYVHVSILQITSKVYNISFGLKISKNEQRYQLINY